MKNLKSLQHRRIREVDVLLKSLHFQHVVDDAGEDVLLEKTGARAQHEIAARQTVRGGVRSKALQQILLLEISGLLAGTFVAAQQRTVLVCEVVAELTHKTQIQRFLII